MQSAERFSDSTKVFVNVPVDTTSIQIQSASSWFRAVKILGKMKSDFHDRALSLQQFLSGTRENNSNNLPERTKSIVKFIADEHEKPENRDLSLPQTGGLQPQLGMYALMHVVGIFPQGNVSETYSDALCMAMRITMVKAGLRQTAWTPHATPADLKEVLKKNGPMIIFGRFGQKFYETPAFKLEDEFCNKEVWGWKPDTKRSSERGPEAVIVVGALVNQAVNRVFFIDPLEAVDPVSKSRKVYAISFKNLETHIVNDSQKLFSAIKSDDHVEIPHMTAETCGKIPLFNVLQNPQQKHPGMSYTRSCKSIYGYQYPQ